MRGPRLTDRPPIEDPIQADRYRRKPLTPALSPKRGEGGRRARARPRIRRSHPPNPAAADPRVRRATVDRYQWELGRRRPADRDGRGVKIQDRLRHERTARDDRPPRECPNPVEPFNLEVAPRVRGLAALPLRQDQRDEVAQATSTGSTSSTSAWATRPTRPRRSVIDKLREAAQDDAEPPLQRRLGRLQPPQGGRRPLRAAVRRRRSTPIRKWSPRSARRRGSATCAWPSSARATPRFGAGAELPDPRPRRRPRLGQRDRARRPRPPGCFPRQHRPGLREPDAPAQDPRPELPPQPDRLRWSGSSSSPRSSGSRSRYQVLRDPRLRLRRRLLRRPPGPEFPLGPGREGRRLRVHDDVEGLQHGRLAGRLRQPAIATMLGALKAIKGYYDYGIFQAVQIAAIVALRHGEDARDSPRSPNTRCAGMSWSRA